MICTNKILMQCDIWIGCDGDEKHFNSENASICTFWKLIHKLKIKRFQRGSNSRPSACEADVITTTPWNRLVRFRRLCNVTFTVFQTHNRKLVDYLRFIYNQLSDFLFYCCYIRGLFCILHDTCIKKNPAYHETN